MPILPSLPSFTFSRPLYLCCLAAVIACTHSCNKKTDTNSGANPSPQSGGTTEKPDQGDPGKAESSLLSLASDSPVKWQPWNKNVFELAKQERKTVFALIGSGSDPNTLGILKQINDSPSTCELLNKNHVSVLIDSNCDPAMEFLAAGLCLKVGSPISRPQLIWFSYEGYPVSWNAAQQGLQTDLAEVVSRMSQTVDSLWREGPEYILKDSREGLERKTINTVIIPSEEPDEYSAIKAIRQISSFYDPTSNNIDGIGKMSAGRFVNLLAKAAASKAIPESQKERYIDIAQRSANSAIIYGLVDPVDQGVFDSNQRTSTALPVFAKSLKTQALSMEALYNLYRLTGDQTQLATANNIKAYTEKNLKQENGDYILSIVYSHNEGTDNRCTWTLEELQKALTEEELNLCKLAFGIRKTGNIPLVDDWNRDHFNKNTLSWKTTREELAKQAAMDPQKANSLLESAMKKIAELRNNRGPAILKEKLISAKTLALYSKSLVTGYRVTGDKTHLDDAQRVFALIKSDFFDKNGKLRETKFENKLSTLPPSASGYAIICDTALDLHEVTLDKTYLDLAQALHTEMSNTRKGEGDQYLYEQDFSRYPVDYKVTFPVTIPYINNISTWALAWSNSTRLLRYQEDEQLENQKQSFDKYFHSLSNFSPIIIIDFLTKYAGFKTPDVYLNGKVSDDLLTTAIRRPCHIITMNGNSHHDLEKEVPVGSAAIVRDGKLLGITDQASELKQWLK